MRYWILSGTPNNWTRAISEGVWGVRENLKNFWDRVSKGDIAIFYVMQPLVGVNGYGVVGNKYKQDTPIWDDELKENRVKYPYRFDFDITYVLPKNQWKEKIIKVGDLPINYRKGINPMVDKTAIDGVLKRIDEEWDIKLDTPSPSEYAVPEEKKLSTHDELIEMIYEIGRAKGLYTEKEYPVNAKRLDVVWMRVSQTTGGAPTYAFEVQVGGNITDALAKLRTAYNRWNSNILIIVSEEDNGKVQSSLTTLFPELTEKITILDTKKVRELYEITIKKNKLESTLNL
ncbi:EVE domain-containing protein [Candidatus Altiarchaeota archaeon]